VVPRKVATPEVLPESNRAESPHAPLDWVVPPALPWMAVTGVLTLVLFVPGIDIAEPFAKNLGKLSLIIGVYFYKLSNLKSFIAGWACWALH
jgi:hypothetical protein